MILFLTLQCQPSVLAYAAHCQTDTQGRPLAGTVVICREQLKQERYRHDTVVQVMFWAFKVWVWVQCGSIQILCLFFQQLLVHELFHVLGFSRTLFSTWRDCSHSHQGQKTTPVQLLVSVQCFQNNCAVLNLHIRVLVFSEHTWLAGTPLTTNGLYWTVNSEVVQNLLEVMKVSGQKYFSSLLLCSCHRMHPSSVGD